MKVGMMWYDGGAEALDQRVRRAVAYYQDKYGGRPNVCFVHPSGAGDSAADGVDSIRVRASELVLPGHLWVGIERRPDDGTARRRALI